MLNLTDLPIVSYTHHDGGLVIPPEILSTLFLVSVLVFSHIISRLIVAELRERRAYRRAQAARAARTVR